MYYIPKPQQDLSSTNPTPTLQATKLGSKKVLGKPNYQKSYRKSFLGNVLLRLRLGFTPNPLNTHQNYGGIINRESLNRYNYEKPDPYESQL